MSMDTDKELTFVTCDTVPLLRKKSTKRDLSRGIILVTVTKGDRITVCVTKNEIVTLILNKDVQFGPTTATKKIDNYSSFLWQA